MKEFFYLTEVEIRSQLHISYTTYYHLRNLVVDLHKDEIYYNKKNKSLVWIGIHNDSNYQARCDKTSDDVLSTLDSNGFDLEEFRKKLVKTGIFTNYSVVSHIQKMILKDVIRELPNGKYVKN